MFDVEAGTSIGAINAAILVRNVEENDTWEGSPRKLIDFWQYPESSLTSRTIKWWIQLLALVGIYGARSVKTNQL